MIYYKTDEEIELIRESCLLVSKTLAHVASLIRPGITGKYLDKEAETLIRDHQAKPGFKGYNDFPATLCISLNDAVVHGIPSDEPLKEGDLASVDCGVLMNGFYGDSAFTFVVGDVSDEIMHLLRVTNTSLYKGIEKAVVGNRIGDIGAAIQEYAEVQHKYGIVRELVGHGLGKNLHEAPEVPNYGKRGRGTQMKDGLVLAIEPMVNLGRKEVKQANDGWTVITRDGTPAAHYEHTVAVRKGQADILSNHHPVQEALAKNPNSKPIPLLEEVMIG